MSNARERVAASVLRDLEAMQAVMRQIRGKDDRRDVPTLVFVFKDEAGFRAYRPWENISGLYQKGPDTDLIAMEAGDREEVPVTIHHEFMHRYVQSHFGPVPLWLDEGIAELYSNMRIEGTVAEVGRPIPERLAWLRAHGLMPFERMARVGHDSPDYREEDRQGTFYAQSWALTHYILLGNETRRGQLPALLDRLARGEPIDKAWRAAFGAGFDALERELNEYIHAPTMTYRRMTVDTLKSWKGPEWTVMDRADVLCQLGSLLARDAKGDFERAESLLLASLELRPGYAPAVAARGRLRDVRGHSDEALGFYRQALALDPRLSSVAFLAAELLITHEVRDGRIDASGPLSPGLVEARRLLDQGLALDPDDPEANAALGLLCVLSGEHAAGIAALEKALPSLSSRSDVVTNLAQLHIRAGSAERAQRLIDGVLAPTGNQGAADHLRGLLARRHLSDAGSALEAGDREAAQDHLDRARGLLADERVRQALGARLAEVNAAVARMERLLEQPAGAR
jgi:tetratricopeptide (TPR) repeat protein